MAGEFGLKTIDDVMGFTPFAYHWEGVAGTSIDAVHVTAVLKGGTIPLVEKWERAHACNYDPTTSEEAPTIGEQIADWNVIALEFRREYYATYRDSDSDEDYVEIVLLAPTDWREIRRRVEDVLHKTKDKTTIYKIAKELGVKIYP